MTLGPSASSGVAAKKMSASSNSDHSQESQSSARFTPDSDFEAADYKGNRHDSTQGYELKEFNPNAKGARRQHSDDGPSSHDENDDPLEDSDDEDVETTLDPSKHGRRSSVQSFELYTPEEERRVRHKLDTRLILFVALLYLLSFLDRSNIGNAKIAGLTDDLDLSDSQYEWLLTIFYIMYILFEWMTIMYQLVPAHIYVSICVCAWGILASLQALATTWSFLMVLRAFLGIGEAAFVGIPIYLSFFFRRDELAFRTGIFISAAPLATSFASSLAYAIVSLGDRTGIASWRLLFLVEGFPAVIVAVWCYYWIPDSPGTARWLNRRERKVAMLRLRREASGEEGNEKPGSHLNSQLPRHKKKFQWHQVLLTLSDPKSYLTASMFFCVNVAFSSMPVFLPTIVHDMGYDRLSSQGLSAPPFLFSFVVVLVTAYLSDRLKSRSIPILFHAAMAMGGYLFLAIAGGLQTTHNTIRYLAVYPICAGFFSAVTIIITWTVNNQASDEGKGTGMALLNIIGQMGPLLGTRLYPDGDGPYYVKGMSVCAVAMSLVCILALTLRFVLSRENARRKAKGNEAEGQALVGENVEEKGFIFML